jgi:hypothetical protein
VVDLLLIGYFRVIICRYWGSLDELTVWFVWVATAFLWGMWTFPYAAVLAASMVGDVAWATGRRWRSTLGGHVQWARGGPSLHGGG